MIIIVMTVIIIITITTAYPVAFLQSGSSSLESELIIYKVNIFHCSFGFQCLGGVCYFCCGAPIYFSLLSYSISMVSELHKGGVNWAETYCSDPSFTEQDTYSEGKFDSQQCSFSLQMCVHAFMCSEYTFVFG